MRPHRYMTSEQLARSPVADQRTELIRGRLVIREPARSRHGEIAARALVAIANHVDAHRVGRVYAAETGFTLARNPDTVRAPDVAYVREDRIPVRPTAGFDALAPDLVVEVLSPGDRRRAVRAKVQQWLASGTRLVWVLDPARRSASVHRADGSASVVDENGQFDGEDVLPGLLVSVAALLRE